MKNIFNIQFVKDCFVKDRFEALLLVSDYDVSVSKTCGDPLARVAG